uniref:Uncharacterized protein n=1 Tax=Octopus bimaculoides TaxID=37653 RepID=A0A0L8HY40_OCTBM
MGPATERLKLDLAGSQLQFYHNHAFFFYFGFGTTGIFNFIQFFSGEDLHNIKMSVTLFSFGEILNW